jgi:ATP-dependent DNA helicase RecG
VDENIDEGGVNDSVNGVNDSESGVDVSVNGVNVSESGVNDTESGVNDSESGVDNSDILSKNEMVVLGQLKANNDISIIEIMKVTGLARRTIDRIIKKLKDKGYIKRNGTTKSGFWQILK